MRPRAIAALLAVVGPFGCRRGDGDVFGTVERHGRPQDTLVLNAGAEPEHLDPGKAADQGSALLALHLCEPLLGYHPRTSAIVSGVAERYEISADARRYRFHLREDARWSDGRPVLAADFAYAWRRVLTPATGSRSAAILYVLANAEALHRGRLSRTTRPLVARDGSTVPAGALVRVEPKGAVVVRSPTFRAQASARADGVALDAPEDSLAPAASSEVGVRATAERVLDVELEYPSPQFPEIVANVTACPVREDVVEPFAARGVPDLWTRPEHHVGNGPFVIESARFRYDLVLARNPHFHDAPAVVVRRVIFTFVEDVQTALWLYRTGELDFFGNSVSLPSAALPMVEGKRDLHRFPYLATYWYELNARRPPFDDARVRRAFFLGVDRRTLTEQVLPGRMLPASHVVPGATGGGYGEALRAAGDPFGEGFDPARARALLASAGFPVEREGERWVARAFPPVELLYNNAEGHRLAAVAVQAMWEQHLGVRVTLRSEEWKVVLSRLRRGEFDIGRYGWAAEYDHPHTFLEPFSSMSPQNVSGLVDPELDRALAQATQEPDRAKAGALYLDVERRAVESASRVPLYFYTKSTLVQPRIRGFVPNPRNAHLAHWLAVDAEPRFDPAPLPTPARLE